MSKFWAVPTEEGIKTLQKLPMEQLAKAYVQDVPLMNINMTFRGTAPPSQSLPPQNLPTLPFVDLSAFHLPCSPNVSPSSPTDSIRQVMSLIQ